MAQSIAVIGGGPGGLFSARLLARAHPDWSITVHERLPPTDTFGFGVGLTPALLTAVGGADEDVRDDLVDASVNFSKAAFQLPSGTAELPTSHAGAISRAKLLQILVERAREAGVTVDIGSDPTVDDVRGDADVVIAADGVASPTREQLADEFGATEWYSRGQLIWLGAEIELEGNIFVPVRTEAGTFVAHCYPYAPGLATFVIEADDESLDRAGCVTTEFAGVADSDEASLDYLSAVFSELIEGKRFIGNKSRWMRFRTVRCERWVHENIVLLGDAAATVHPTLGSGTKVAMDAATHLATANSFDQYEASFRPSVERLQEKAMRSQLWWESFPDRLGLSPARIAASYMSRAGAISLEQLHAASPALAAQAAADFAGVRPDEVPERDLLDWVLHRPFDAGDLTFPGRIANGELDGAATLEVPWNDAWSDEAQAALDGLAGAGIVRLTGGHSRGALLDRLALGERIRSELGAVVAVTSDEEHIGDAVDGIVAGRADLITIGGK